MFLAGLLDWVGNSPPEYDSIAGREVLEQGMAHVKTIVENMGAILGYRPLEEDGIEPQTFLSESPGQGCMLMHGYEILRPATPQEQALYSVITTWGYGVIRLLAEYYFGNATT